MSLLEIKGLETEFQTEQGVVKALRGINYTVDRREVLGIVVNLDLEKALVCFHLWDCLLRMVLLLQVK